MQPDQHWDEIKALFRASFKSTYHYAIATTGADGEPHITPIGSLILTEPGRGYYFEKFTNRLPQNLKNDRRVCVLAVDSSPWFWLKSLVGGRFATAPAIRLYGTAGEPRPAHADEIRHWHRLVHSARFTKGYRLMWRDMNRVRDIQFDRIEPVNIGAMTDGLWTAAR